MAEPCRKGCEFWSFNLRLSSRKRSCKCLYVKPEMHDIAVLYDVFLAFQTPFSGIFCPLLAFVGNKVGIGNYFGADKAFFKVGVNHRGGLGGS